MSARHENDQQHWMNFDLNGSQSPEGHWLVTLEAKCSDFEDAVSFKALLQTMVTDIGEQMRRLLPEGCVQFDNVPPPSKAH